MYVCSDLLIVSLFSYVLMYCLISFVICLWLCSVFLYVVMYVFIVCFASVCYCVRSLFIQLVFSCFMYSFL